MSHYRRIAQLAAAALVVTSLSQVVGGWKTPAAGAVPDPPAAVNPEPWFNAVTGSGPTQVSGSIDGDTTWGPQGSPYVVSGTLTVNTPAALTLLPGTTVRMGPAAKLVVKGQLLSLGTPQDHVTITSVDDTGESGGSPGQWKKISIAPTTEQAPPTIIDYTDIRYGGDAANPGCLSGGMIEAASWSRLVLANSNLRESAAASVSVNAGESGYVGVYGNYFGSAPCAVNDRGRGDYVGNQFDSGADTIGFFGIGMEGGRFWYNKFLSGLMVNAGGGMDIEYNSLRGIEDFGIWPEQYPFLAHNWWYRDLQPRDGNEGSSPAECGLADEIDQLQPPVIPVADYGRCAEMSPRLFVPGEYRLDVLPALHDAPPELPGAVERLGYAHYGAVDTTTGAVTYAESDLSINDAGEQVTMTRTYESSRAPGRSDIGEGWRSSFSDELTPLPYGDAVLVTSDGEDLPLSLEWKAPGVAADYSKDESGNSTVRAADNTTYSFDSTGRLTSMLVRDPGHRLDIIRGDSGEIDKVVNGQRIVVDGHHRLAAARRAGIDVQYQVVDPSTVIRSGMYTSIDDILRSTYSVGPDRLR